MSSTEVTSRASSNRSLVGTAWHSSTARWASALALSASGGLRGYSQCPCSKVALQLPQTPERQEYGKATPARCAASSTVSPSATENWRSEDFRVTVCTRRIVVAIAGDNNAGSHHGNQR